MEGDEFISKLISNSRGLFSVYLLSSENRENYNSKKTPKMSHTMADQYSQLLESIDLCDYVPSYHLREAEDVNINRIAYDNSFWQILRKVGFYAVVHSLSFTVNRIHILRSLSLIHI